MSQLTNKSELEEHRINDIAKDIESYAELNLKTIEEVQAIMFQMHLKIEQLEKIKYEKKEIWIWNQSKWKLDRIKNESNTKINFRKKRLNFTITEECF